LIALEVAAVPYLTHPYLIPNYAPFSLLKMIHDDPETATVFVVPTQILYPQEQYFQMFHEKPIYGGDLARRPEYLWRRYYGLPGLGKMFWERREELDGAEAAADLSPEFVDRFVEFHNIKYMILAPESKRTPMRYLAESRFPTTRQWTEKSFILYEIRRPPADRPLSADLSEPWGILYTGRGFWPPTENIGSWAGSLDADLVLPLRGHSWKTLEIEMTPFHYEGAATQTAEVSLNGCLLGHVILQPSLTYYRFTIPREALDDRPYSTLHFRFAYCVSPSSLGISKDRRPLAVSVRRLHVRSTPRDGAPIARP
jgi:hypothetical protein